VASRARAMNRFERITVFLPTWLVSNDHEPRLTLLRPVILPTLAGRADVLGIAGVAWEPAVRLDEELFDARRVARAATAARAHAAAGSTPTAAEVAAATPAPAAVSSALPAPALSARAVSATVATKAGNPPRLRATAGTTRGGTELGRGSVPAAAGAAVPAPPAATPRAAPPPGD